MTPKKHTSAASSATSDAITWNLSRRQFDLHGPESTSSDTEQVGATLLDRYVLDALIGRGSTSQVYRAQDLQTETIVAIKMDTRNHRFPKTNHHNTLLEEHQVLQEIDHSNVIKALRTHTLPNGTQILVMEWLDGVTLSTLISEGRLSPKQTLGLLLQAFQGLGAIHSTLHVHGDISVSNLIVSGWTTEHPTLKIIDFGLAKHRSESLDTASDHGFITGTPTFMAPARILGHSGSPCTDLYALGVLLYRCLTGFYPFKGSSPAETLHAHLHGEFEPLTRRLGYKPWVLGAQELVDSLLKTKSLISCDEAQQYTIALLQTTLFDCQNNPTILA